jgi:cyclic-di-GMP-binding protein
MVLSLSVPVTVRSLPKEIAVTPERARAWVESLPLTRTIDAARALLGTVAALNRGKLGSEDRIALLEIYRPTRDALLAALDASYAYAPLPLQAAPQQALDLARQLLMEYGYGYKMHILEKTGKFIFFNARKSLPAPVYKALDDLKRLMLQAYKTYHPIGTGLWQEAHTLFAYADEQGFADDAIDPPGHGSIRQLHTDLLMLFLADPYRLMHGEVERVAALLQSHRGLVQVTPLAAAEQDRVRPLRPLIVALDSDAPPRAITPGVRAPTGDALRQIEPGALLSTLRESLQSSHSTANAARSRATHDLDDLVTRLLRMWSDPPRRQSHRNAVTSAVALCSGIKSIAYFCELATNESEAGATGTATAMVNQVFTPALPQDPVSQLVGVETWGVANQSAHGLRLTRAITHAVSQIHESRVGVTVGEVVGLRFAHTRAWSIGIVRWLTVLSADEMECGVELIAPAAANVMTRRAPQQTHAALLVATSAKENTSDTLLAESGSFAGAEPFDIIDQGKRFHVRATTLIESTSRFDLFIFEPA